MKSQNESSDLTAVQNSKAISNQALLALMLGVLTKGSAFRFTAQGNSMDPFIKNGDTLTIAPLHSRLEVGDIIVFAEPGTDHVIVHRVIRIAKDSYQTRGDAILSEDDGWIPADRTFGRVTRIQREDKEIRVGLGPEKWLISFLSARGFLPQITSGSFLQFLRKLVIR